MIYFTADHHFNHTNIIKFCNRPFATVEEMNTTMIARWNEVVKHDDTVYHLGDFTLEGPVVAEQFFAALNGHIGVIPGGHDVRWLADSEQYYSNGYMVDPVEILPPLVSLEFPELGKGGRPHVIVLCHYAMRVWDRSHHGAWHLYGHSHGNLPVEGLSFDVGVDCHDFRPISLGEVAARMASLKGE